MLLNVVLGVYGYQRVVKSKPIDIAVVPWLCIFDVCLQRYHCLFTTLSSISGLLCELNQLNRKALLVTCGILWSIMTSLGGFATHYWHQAVARILLGVL